MERRSKKRAAAQEEKAAKKLAEKVGIEDIYELASGVIDLANTNMYGAIREVSIERGSDPADLTLVAFGGAGGLHAAALADRLEMARVLVPKNAGIFSALGIFGQMIWINPATETVIAIQSAWPHATSWDLNLHQSKLIRAIQNEMNK